MWTTRYIGIIAYSLVSALLIAKDVVQTTEQSIALLAPIAAFVVADQIKHRNE